MYNKIEETDLGQLLRWKQDRVDLFALNACYFITATVRYFETKMTVKLKSAKGQSKSLGQVSWCDREIL